MVVNNKREKKNKQTKWNTLAQARV